MDDLPSEIKFIQIILGSYEDEYENEKARKIAMKSKIPLISTELLFQDQLKAYVGMAKEILEKQLLLLQERLVLEQKIKLQAENVKNIATEGSNFELLKMLEEKIDTIGKSVNPPTIYRTGSSVKTEDFRETFGFTISTISVIKDYELFSWKDNEQFNAFKSIVKTAVLNKLDQFITYANSSDKLEDSSLRPILQELLSELIPHAFASIPESEIIVDRYEYNDAKVIDKKGKPIVFNGITDLSCLLVPNHVPVCGFENKISKKSLILKRTRVEDVNADGKKAISQTASQIPGAIHHIEALNVTVPAYTQIGTNGWQYVMVRRVNLVKGGWRFLASVPVSLGVESNGKVFAKSDLGESIESVSHMIALMFDNARFLVQKILKDSTLTQEMSRLNFYKEDDNHDKDDNDNGSVDKNFPFNADLLPYPPPVGRNQSSNMESSTTQQNDNTKTEGKGKRIPLGEINENIILPLTISALKYHNSIM